MVGHKRRLTHANMSKCSHPRGIALVEKGSGLYACECPDCGAKEYEVVHGIQSKV